MNRLNTIDNKWIAVYNTDIGRIQKNDGGTREVFCGEIKIHFSAVDCRTDHCLDMGLFFRLAEWRNASVCDSNHRRAARGFVPE